MTGQACGRQEEALTWDYRTKVLDFLKPAHQVLDMGTGDGTFLLSLGHPAEQVSVMAGGEALVLCRKRLEPLGVRVGAFCDKVGEALPFADGSFDLVLNFHRDYVLPEIRRVLKTGGFFLTEQVGGQDCAALYARLMPGVHGQKPDYNLENELPKWQAAGFRVMYRNQYYPAIQFADGAALCRYAEESGRTCPQHFSAALEGWGHRFFLIAKKKS